MAGNLLKEEKSPYLLQHKDNPVGWYPWGEAAFAAAREQQKPIFLSIGYSTCYWCHVMESDSFEREEVAEVLNKYFISIKVDREERPDIDQIYMDAVVAMNGQGGWPMSVFLTADRKPFWGGTFFWRGHFLSILTQIHEKWRVDREQIEDSSEKITDFLIQKDEVPTPPGQSVDGSMKAFTAFQNNFDSTYGGFGKAPKFPPAMAIGFLLRYAKRVQSDAALTMVKTTLNRMAHGGIYDQLAGGFSRYATDREWLVPHFEKMLYDNALLARAYAEAFSATGEVSYQAIGKHILRYIKQEMTDPAGGFYSAEDAGKVGKEGEFYVWQYSELQKLLTEEELDLAVRLFGVSKEGDFEGHIILTFAADVDWQERERPAVQSVIEKLLHARGKRSRPHLDDKILTAWNALMISAYLEAYRSFGDPLYLSEARKQTNFLLTTLYREGKLLRRFRDGDARFAGTLEDYAFLIDALITLHQSTRDHTWLLTALTLQEKQDELFWDSEQGGYFSSTAADLYFKKKDFFDNAIPSGNAVSLRNLISLAGLSGAAYYYERYEQLLQVYGNPLRKYPSGLAEALREMERLASGVKEVVIVYTAWTEELTSFWNDVRRRYGDQVLLLAQALDQTASEKLLTLRGRELLNGKPTFYVCEKGRCALPVNDMKKAIELLP